MTETENEIKLKFIISTSQLSAVMQGVDVT